MKTNRDINSRNFKVKLISKKTGNLIIVSKEEASVILKKSPDKYKIDIV